MGGDGGDVGGGGGCVRMGGAELAIEKGRVAELDIEKGRVADSQVRLYSWLGSRLI